MFKLPDMGCGSKILQIHGVESNQGTQSKFDFRVLDQNFENSLKKTFAYLINLKGRFIMMKGWVVHQWRLCECT